ncbi:MAG: hypothetical protein LC802_07150 [Acidobacteria bacterium]|nr:hypothetical protein [Acidobacteriota bacterium]
MREFLSKMVGKKINIFCGGPNFKGKVVKVDEGVVHMVNDDDQMFYVAVDRIIVVSEEHEAEQKAGFITGFRK